MSETREMREKDPYKLALKRGIVRAHIAFVAKNKTSVAISCLKLEDSSMDPKKLEEAIMLLQEQTDFAPSLLCDDGTVLIFMKEMQLHRCVQMVKAIGERLQRDTGIVISHGALTIIDVEDSYEELISRLERYLHSAGEVGGGRICYGTSRYDFCVEGDENQIFSNFFTDHAKVTLYNFYNGMPLSEEVEVVEYKESVLKIKTSLARAAFLKKEPFTFIRHPELPDTIKADILNTLPTRAEVILGHLHFIDKSPVDRENIRVMPDEMIEASIECADGQLLDGVIHSLAVNSIAVRINEEEALDACLELDAKHVTITFDLPEREQRRSHLEVSGLLRYKKEDQVIFSIYPNHFFKQKIESYIALQQTRLITIMQKMVLNFYQ